MYCAYVTKIRNLRKHTNADRLLCGECFGNKVIVDLSIEPDQLGVYFPVDGKLGVEFAQKNDLLRRKDEKGNPAGGYLNPEKRSVKALKLRGEQSDGLFMPLSCLDGFTDISKLSEGDTITVLNGVTICEKYIPKQRHQGNGGGNKGNRVRKRFAPISPLFQEHTDTEQLAYNLSAFRPGDLVEITLKMHGTSQRTGYLPILQGYQYNNGLEKKLFESERTPNWLRSKIKRTPIYDWGYVTGTRRVVLDNFDGGFYGSNAFREQHAKVFEGKLRKGEEVYYEVVGFTDDGTPIMNPGNNAKIGDKEFSKQYGKTTFFSYGCDSTGKVAEKDENGVSITSCPKSDLYVYRMTMTNEDGDVVEYPPDFMRYRCEQMGVKCVPLFCRIIIPDLIQLSDDVGSSQTVNAGEFVKKLAEDFYDGPDPVGKTHIREGVVCRIVNRPKFAAYKHKNFYFKVLEGLIKDAATAPDMEEAQEIERG